MGSQTSDEETTIRTEIDLNVKQINEQFMKIKQDTMMSVATSVSNTQLATVQQNSGAFNDIELHNLHITNGSTFNVELNADVTQNTQAIMSITQDETLQNTIISQTQDIVTQKLKANQDLSDDLKLVADIEKKQQTDGELNTFVDSIKEMITSLAKQNITDKTTVERTIKQSLLQESKNSTDIETIVKNSFKTTLSMSSLNKCLGASSASNRVTADGIWVDDGSTVNLDTQAIQNQVNKCVISTLLTSDVYQYLENDTGASGNQDTDAGQSVQFKVDEELKKIWQKIETSFLDIIMNNITIIVAIIGVVVVLGMAIVGGPIIGKMFSSIKKKRK